MPFSTTETNAILKYELGLVNTPPTVKNAVYIGLLTNDPEADKGTCTEFTTTAAVGYHRVRIAKYTDSDSNKIALRKERVITNDEQINWTKAGNNWPEAKGIALYTTEVVGSGTAFYYSKIPTPFATEAGDVALFERADPSDPKSVGDLVISMISTDSDYVDEDET
jgi:hypothetical protein